MDNYDSVMYYMLRLEQILYLHPFFPPKKAMKTSKILSAYIWENWV